MLPYWTPYANPTTSASGRIANIHERIQNRAGSGSVFVAKPRAEAKIACEKIVGMKLPEQLWRRCSCKMPQVPNIRTAHLRSASARIVLSARHDKSSDVTNAARFAMSSIRICSSNRCAPSPATPSPSRTGTPNAATKFPSDAPPTCVSSRT